MNRIKVWPHAVLIALGIAILAAAGVIIWKRYEPSAAAKALPNAARLERVQGEVAINNSLSTTSSGEWKAATTNTPVSEGDRLYTRDNSRADVAFTGRNFATVDGNTSLDVLELSSERTQVALREGSALFDIGSLGSGQTFEVATPCGAIDIRERGMYRIAIDEQGSATATAFSGSAELLGQGGTATVSKGEELTLPCQGSSATISRVNYDNAGALVDSYYRYRYPNRYDGRYRSYYTYLDDPYYYDPYDRYASYQYVSDYIPGVYDLDDYGDWRYMNDYGYCWHPRVAAGWAPYQYGYWDMVYPYGLTWISTEPWGYAPYHYGRWAYVGNDWFWVPGSAYGYPTYSPSLTAFFSFGDSSIGWVPLGPGDPYTYYYYDPYWQPVYLTSYPTTVQFVNVAVPNAVTVVRAQDFDRVIDPTIITSVDRRTIARVQPVLDPLRVKPLRDVAFATAKAQRRIDVPRSVAQVIDRPVVTTSQPIARPFKRDMTALRVQTINDRARNQKLQLRDERAATAPQAQTQAPSVAAEQERERKIADLSRQAARGDRSARQQMQELRRQQVEQRRIEHSIQQPRSERVGQPMQMRQQQRAAERQQTRQLRRATEQQRLQTRPVPQRPEMQRPQAPAIRNAPRPQPVRPQPVRPQVMRPQPQPRKPEVQYRPPQSQPRVVTPRPTRPQIEQQVRPRIEYKGPPVSVRPQVQQQQAAPRAQPQPRQPNGGPPAARGGAPAAKGGKPKKP